MTQLILIDGGSRTLDLARSTVITMERPNVYNGYRRHPVLLYVDDKERKERLVLKFEHVTTLTGNKPRKHPTTELGLTTIMGYDPDKNCWGPTERRSFMDIEWANSRRLLEEITAYRDLHFEPYGRHVTWYRKK